MIWIYFLQFVFVSHREEVWEDLTIEKAEIERAGKKIEPGVWPQVYYCIAACFGSCACLPTSTVGHPTCPIVFGSQHVLMNTSKTMVWTLTFLLLITLYRFWPLIIFPFVNSSPYQLQTNKNTCAYYTSSLENFGGQNLRPISMCVFPGPRAKGLKNTFGYNRAIDSGCT